ncbi:SRPBCC domain-containing protein [Aureibacillus halotolerans]|uniref:Uncharacterized protein YndB with AHSA1/START domain n=1 Tax=Aureibacillus halotolerans TaxID=1508390 RepID=A0A4R6TVC4_9BACI|nr:SRPBCC domain-containing protein [Aureibacillus halotolerans]TDQ36612.1 uncharacterized protein YndB with AHSA1/START domain [Aureibacillus halotolerans]
MPEITVLRSIWIDATRERVWQAVTDENMLSQWYSPGSPWEIPELKVGEPAFFHHSPNAYHEGTEVVTMEATIDALDLLSRFSLRWVDEPTTVTSFILKEEDGGTLVTLTETGYDTEEDAKLTEEGYQLSLENLQAFVDGRSLPH